jgi:uncharacterized Zn finger protein (UPF0148 family)
MELRVQLKVCEGCGCLWYRVQNQGTVYCKECEVRLRDFPVTTILRRRRGQERRPLGRLDAAACMPGGAQ